LLNIRIKVDDNDSKTKAGMAYNRALKWKIDHLSSNYKLNSMLLSVQTRRARTS
jgi:hypothetical protein